LTAVASGEPDQIQTAVNAGFGELYSNASRGERPEWQQVMAHKLAYRKGEVPKEVLRLVMGVDVQKNSLIYVVRGFGARGASWLVEEGQIYGPTDDDEVWDDLADRITTPFDDMVVERVLIDSGFRPDKPDAGDEHKVYEFCRKWSWIAKPTKGLATSTQPFAVSKIEVTPKGKKAPYSLDLMRVNTDFFKSLVYSRLHTENGAPGCFYVHMDVTEDYCRQVVSEARTLGKNGKPEWVRVNRANHFLDCEALCAVAAYSLNVQRLPDGVLRQKGVATLEATKAAEEIDKTIDQQPGLKIPLEVIAKQAVANQKEKTNFSIRDRFSGLGSRFNR